jgi:serine/threonine protein kinase
MHSDLKPDNLIRRAGDNKLCLIDFGAAQQIDKDFELALSGCYERPLDATKNNLENLPLGYIPAEQLTSKAKPSSDIYALGLIAILALTGLEPTQLNLDLDTREVIWKDLVPVSDKLVSIINKMVRYDFQDRYQSASDVLRSLSNMPVINQQPEKKSLTFKVPNFQLKIPKSFFVRGRVLPLIVSLSLAGCILFPKFLHRKGGQMFYTRQRKNTRRGI